MRASRLLAPATAALITAACATTMPVEYGPTSSGQTAAESAEQLRLPPPPPPPARSGWQLSLTEADRLDHEAMLLSFSCSAHNYPNALSSPLRTLLQAMDADGALDSGDARRVTIEVSGANSSIRCVQTGELRSGCITQVEILATAHVEDAASDPIPLVGRSSLVSRGGGFCGSIPRVVRHVSDQAMAAFAADLQAKLPR